MKTKYVNLFLAITFCVRLLQGWLFSVIIPPVDPTAYWHRNAITLVFHGLLLSICIIAQNVVQWHNERRERFAEGKTGAEIEKLKRRNDLILLWSVGVVCIGLLLWSIVSIIV